MKAFGAVGTPDPSASGPAQDIWGKKFKTRTRLKKSAEESLVEEKQVCLGGICFFYQYDMAVNHVICYVHCLNHTESTEINAACRNLFVNKKQSIRNHTYNITMETGRKSYAAKWPTLPYLPKIILIIII